MDFLNSLFIYHSKSFFLVQPDRLLDLLNMLALLRVATWRFAAICLCLTAFWRCSASCFLIRAALAASAAAAAWAAFSAAAFELELEVPDVDVFAVVVTVVVTVSVVSSSSSSSKQSGSSGEVLQSVHPVGKFGLYDVQATPSLLWIQLIANMAQSNNICTILILNDEQRLELSPFYSNLQIR